MKKYLFFVVTCACAISCGSSNKMMNSATQPAVESSIATKTTLEGTQVNVESTLLQGIELSDALSEDGLSIVKRPFRWFAGIGRASDKQIAIEIAQREAYATLSRIISNIVNDQGRKGAIINNQEVQLALKLNWDQFSSSVQSGCEPFGSTTIEYDPSTKIYSAVAKIGIRGDRYIKLLNAAGSYKPSNLSGSNLEQFIAVNNAIMEAAKGSN